METTTQNDILFIIASGEKEFEDAKNLFKQYADSLDIDLSFQDFSNEINTIDKQYNKPSGALLLAYKNGEAVGCAGLRKFDEEQAELKRMFVKTEYRQFKIGKKLLELIINMAKDLHYKSILLDTLPSMAAAQMLYKSFGFYEIPSYRFNPISGTVYMKKELD